jgi:hypothetical protein
MSPRSIAGISDETCDSEITTHLIVRPNDADYQRGKTRQVQVQQRTPGLRALTIDSHLFCA